MWFVKTFLIYLFSFVGAALVKRVTLIYFVTFFLSSPHLCHSPTDFHNNYVEQFMHILQLEQIQTLNQQFLLKILNVFWVPQRHIQFDSERIVQRSILLKITCMF